MNKKVTWKRQMSQNKTHFSKWKETLQTKYTLHSINTNSIATKNSKEYKKQKTCKNRHINLQGGEPFKNFYC